MIRIEADNRSAYDITTKAKGPAGSLPLDPEYLRRAPSGELFGLTESAGMGWNPVELRRRSFLILGTSGGIRREDGSPVALGYHTGHWEIGLLMEVAANRLKELESIPFAAFVSDPCDGRTQGTVGMMDSLAYRNDAAIVLGRLIRSLPTRSGVMGVATCDKGLPAMMMALAGARDLPTVLVPGGVTLPPETGEDAGKVQTIGARFAHGEITLEEAASLGCRACASPGGGCQFLGTAATSQVVAEALGIAVVHSALAPSGQEIWKDAARRSAEALVSMEGVGMTVSDVITASSVRNAMVVHAAFGGSTNLLLHLPAIAYEAGVAVPTVDEWREVNSRVPRIVDVLPNGPVGHPTIRAYLAGGVPEAMLHLRHHLDLDCPTVSGAPLGDVLDEWERSDRRRIVRERLRSADGIDPDTVIMPPAVAAGAGLTSTVTFPTGNLAPEGAVVKSTAIDPSVIGKDGVYRLTGPARVFTSERDAIAAVKAIGGESGDDRSSNGDSPPRQEGVRGIRPGDVMVLIGRGPAGCGMEETYQITSALRYLPHGKRVALVTDARFSGVSTGACIGHVGPEALAGGPIGKLRDGDLVRIVIDCRNLTGSVDFIGTADDSETRTEEAARILAERPPHPALAPDPKIPDATRLWAALQEASGGTWRGCVYDVDRIIELLDSGKRALGG